MTCKLLSRRELEIINRQNFRYPLAVAKKERKLSTVFYIRNIPDSDILKMLQIEFSNNFD